MGRTTLATGLAFVLALIGIKFHIFLMKRMQLGQHIREWGPKIHEHKSGTPTMGGLPLLVALALSFLYLWSSRPTLRAELYLVALATFGFGLIGAADDLIGLFKGQSRGLTAVGKLFFQTALGLVFFFLYLHLFGGVKLDLPLGGELELIPAYLGPLVVFVFLATVNSTNLTDGLDGLATGATLLALVGLASITTGGDLLPLILPFAAVLLAFLWFNCHPAEVFLGDTGSFALGGFLAGGAILGGVELYLPLFGGLFALESISVILQVSSYKLTGKRIFKVSPFHHHFERAEGVDYDYLLPEVVWEEPRITVRLWLLQTVTVASAVFLYYG